MTDDAQYREQIRAQLDSTLSSGFIPELGKHKKGKVRNVHFSNGKVVMVASDRVSVFDHVLSRYIPYKGAVLNLFNQWAMDNTSDIMLSAQLQSPDPNVIVQSQLTNFGFECIVRGYVWGSLAEDYEAGKREKSGIPLPDGLYRYGKLTEPLFTPTTKAEKGHDVDITLEDIVKVHGRELAEQARDLSIRLFVRGQQVAARRGWVLIDTKFEFGVDGNEELVLIDESLTPDSSRYCTHEEYNGKMRLIEREIQTGRYKTVGELVRAHPELKIREESKQYVRDVVVEAGWKDGKPLPKLTDEQVVETAFRYIKAYESLTGRSFPFHESELAVPRRIIHRLAKAGLIYGGCVIPIGASEKDKEHWGKLEAALKDAKIPFTEPVFLSAHKRTKEVLEFVHQTDESIESIVYLTFAGRSNGLGPVVAGNTNNPVVTCPVFSDIGAYVVDVHSSLRMPGGLPLMTVVDPGNAVLACKRILDVARTW